MGTRIIAHDQEHCVAIWERVLIQIWYGEARVPAIQAMSRACDELLRTSQGDVSTLALIEAAAPAPDDAGRKALAEWSGRVASRLARAAVVAEGGGFRSSLVRGVGLAFTTLTPHRLPFKFFATVADAAAYLGPSLSETGGGPPHLEAAIGALRVKRRAGASKPM